MRLLIFAALALLLHGTRAFAQESQFEADSRSEREHIAESCSGFDFKAVGGCVYSLATESPFHVGFGSLAPHNGLALGLAFNEAYTPNESWRISWNADGVGSFHGSWRAGLYVKLVHTPATSGVVVRQPGATPSSGRIAPRQFAVIDLFAQTISLKTIGYFGPGMDSLESGESVFSERQTITGASIAYPFNNLGPLTGLNFALLGGVAGRFIDVRPGTSDDVPSIEKVYDDASAPGLSLQRPFAEFREGVRVKPSVFGGHLRLNYLLSAQQFRTSSATHSSFNRWTIDLQHEIPIYRNVSSTGPREFNGPNACAQAVGSSACPPVQWSRNREGTIGLRLFVSPSTASGSNAVPFYLQPTLGGSDMNGERRLAGFDDYRFRGPNVLLIQERIEHSIWGPLGAFVLAEQGKVAFEKSELEFHDLVTSATIGITVRAGGFPLINLSFSWGREGHHVIGSIDPTLLGGSARPSLY